MNIRACPTCFVLDRLSTSKRSKWPAEPRVRILRMSRIAQCQPAPFSPRENRFGNPLCYNGVFLFVLCRVAHVFDAGSSVSRTVWLALKGDIPATLPAPYCKAMMAWERFPAGADPGARSNPSHSHETNGVCRSTGVL